LCIKLFKLGIKSNAVIKKSGFGIYSSEKKTFDVSSKTIFTSIENPEGHSKETTIFAIPNRSFL